MMNNEICCIFKINKKQYELISSRLSCYDIHLAEEKELQIVIMKTEVKKPTEQKKKVIERKATNPIVKFIQNKTTTLLVGNHNSKCDQQLVYDANYFRVQNNFNMIMRQWTQLDDLTITETQKVYIQVYVWKQLFVIQFCELSEQVLMVLTDLNSTNFINCEKGWYSEQQWEKKLSYHFKELYTLITNSFDESNPYQRRNDRNQWVHTKKSLQFQAKCKSYTQKLFLINYKQQATGKQSFWENSFRNYQKPIQFWMMKIVYIFEQLIKKRKVDTIAEQQ